MSSRLALKQIGQIRNLPPALQQTLSQPAYATFVSEGRDGGAGLIVALYPR